MSDIILCISAGRSDLQVLVNTDKDGNPGRYRAEVSGREKRSTRYFHEWLLQNLEQIYVSKEDSQDEGKRGKDIVCDADGHIKDSDCLLLTEDGKVQLEPAKIRPLVKSLQEESEVTVKGVIVLNTHRDSESQWAENEPIAVGPILAKWLAEVFELEYGDKANQTGIGISGWLNILDSDMEESGAPGTPDYPLNREIVRRVDKHLQAIHAEWKNTSPLEAYLAIGGGLPSAKSLLKSVASFHFGRRYVKELHVPKGREKGLLWLPVAVTAEDSFLAREHAVSLIRQGDFAGAYGAVKHLKDVSYEKNWVKKVADVSAYFGGQLKYREDLPDYLKDFAKPESPRCLLVAMRTEAALLSNRIADAISLTCTFWDSAILDAIKQNLPVEEIYEVENRMVFSPDYQLNSRLTQGHKPCMDASKFPKVGHYRYNLMGYRSKIWFNIMGKNVKHLEKYRSALDTEIPIDIDGAKKQIPRRNWRNVNTHSLLKLEQLEIAKKVFVKAGFWATDAEQPIAGSCFLAQPLVDNVLKELGETDVSKRYTQLIEGVCGELVRHWDDELNGV